MRIFEFQQQSEVFCINFFPFCLEKLQNFIERDRPISVLVTFKESLANVTPFLRKLFPDLFVQLYKSLG